jgi:signal transduction histidine kinase/CheY-like chemotaxis protein
MADAKNKPIQSKLMAMVLLTCGAALVLACGTIAIYETVMVRESKLRELKLLADLIGTNSAVALSFKDAGAASETLDALKRDPDVVTARIYDKNGAPFATYLRAGTQSSTIPMVAPAEGSNFSGGALHLTRAVLQNGKQTGSVYLELQLSELNLRLVRYALILSVVLLVSLGFAFLLASRLQRTISGPILELAQHAGSIRQGAHYTIGEVKGSYQEIGLLIDSFDGMLSAINQRDAELRHHREHLEDEVAAQTQELRTANAQLAHAKELAENSKKAAEAASRAKGEFLANMSHEIRTPMNGILGMTELAMETELTSTQSEYLSVVKSSADGLLCLINDILDFSKIEAGKLALDAHPFLLHKVIADVMKGLSLRAHQKGLELAFDLDSSIPERLIGDAGRLRQIITNLVGNAIKFTEQGEVVLTVRFEEHQPESGLVLGFAVEDTGIGIPADKLASIFEAFEQADNSTTRIYGGTGLGLSISKRLVELMGGHLWVESQPGMGSRFSFTVKFGLAGTLGKEFAPNPEVLRGVRVLVVDDNGTNRRILHDMLSTWGMEVELAESGPEALAILYRDVSRGITFPLIILDGHMPEMDGFDLLQRIRGAQELKAGKAMVLTSGEQLHSVQRRQELQIAECALKPVSRSELLDLLLRMLGPAEDSDAATASLKTAPAVFHPLQILLAEDNAFNQKVATRMLETAGHSVTVVKNGLEAVEAYSKHHFDLVFMDVQMPVMDGVEATRLIREQQTAGGRVPIIAMTAHAMTGDREKYLSAGMDDYVSKPISREELMNAILRNSVSVSGPASIERGSLSEAKIAGSESENGNSHVRSLASWINQEKLLERVGGDQELLASISSLFPEEVQKCMVALDAARSAKNASEVQINAHTLKGICKMFDATPAANAALDLEKTAEEGALGSETQINTLRAELDRTVEAVKQFHATLGER